MKISNRITELSAGQGLTRSALRGLALVAACLGLLISSGTAAAPPHEPIPIPVQCCNSAVTPSLQWTKSGSGLQGGYEGVHVTTDLQGNVYAVALSNSTWKVVAYEPNGTMKWSNTLITSASPFATPYAVAVDNVGGVYVVGKGGTPTSLDKPIIVKFDAQTGTIVWDVSPTRLNGYFNDVAFGNGLTSPGGSFVVYATGAVQKGLNDTDVYTAAFNVSNGAVVATDLYNGSGNLIDFGAALAVDHQGTVWLVGSTMINVSSAFRSRLMVIEYTPHLQSTNMYIHPNVQNNYSQGYDIAVDRNGNVYVTGYNYRFAGGVGHDFLTIGFLSSFPTPTWVKNYHGGVGNDIAYQIAVDTARNAVFVAGDASRPGGGASLTTIRYNATTGAKVWDHKYPHNSGMRAPGNFFPPRNLVLDHVGNVYVGGMRDDSGRRWLVYKLCASESAPPIVWQYT